MRVLVSILSEQCVPNYVFIKEMEGKYDELYFISSAEVESGNRYGERIEKTLGVPCGSVRRIVIDSDNYFKAYSQIQENELSDSHQYMVNFTGGTKVMSLATFDFFKQREDALLYYKPIKSNQYINATTGEVSPLNYRISLSEYFGLYGIRIESQEQPYASAKRATQRFDRAKNNGFFLRGDLNPSDVVNRSDLSSDERRYCSGGWFEEYAYFRLKSEFGLRDDQIALSLKLYREDSGNYNDNELDVAYVYENELHVVECKVRMTGYGKEAKEVIEEYLYKLSAISKDFGLVVKSYLFTLHKLDRLAEETLANLSKRAKILGISKIVSGPDFVSSRINLNK